jgi:hypothetical protein
MTIYWSKLIILSTIIGCIVSISNGLKILVYCPTISKSHVISSGRIADALAAVGHDVVSSVHVKSPHFSLAACTIFRNLHNCN